MSVYVDGLFQQKATSTTAFRVGAKNNHLWCHMVADTDEELHAMALRIGLKRAWFQRGDHYDLTPGRRKVAVSLGAIEVDRRGLVNCLRRRRGQPELTSRVGVESR